MIARLESGAGGRHILFEGVDLDRCVLHLGDEPELVHGEVVGAALGLDEELGVDALAIVDVGEGNVLVDVQKRADVDLVPGGVLDVVVVDDKIA